jgi:cytochrome c5
MKKEIITAMLAIIFLTACVVRKSEPITQRQFNPKDNQVINGERVFMMYCQKCHPGGEAGLAPSIVSNPFPTIFETIPDQAWIRRNACFQTK